MPDNPIFTIEFHRVAGFRVGGGPVQNYFEYSGYLQAADGVEITDVKVATNFSGWNVHYQKNGMNFIKSISNREGFELGGQQVPAQWKLYHKGSEVK